MIDTKTEKELISKFRSWLQTGQYSEDGNNILKCVIAELEEASVDDQENSIEELYKQITDILDRISEKESYDHQYTFFQNVIWECTRRREDIWEFKNIISRMSEQEIKLCFQLPAREVFDLSLKEVKKRYDAWIQKNREAAEVNPETKSHVGKLVKKTKLRYVAQVEINGLYDEDEKDVMDIVKNEMTPALKTLIEEELIDSTEVNVIQMFADAWIVED